MPRIRSPMGRSRAIALTAQDAQLIWDAQLRMLDKKDPSYKN